jgi:hypothetical protein
MKIANKIAATGHRQPTKITKYANHRDLGFEGMGISGEKITENGFETHLR